MLAIHKKQGNFHDLMETETGNRNKERRPTLATLRDITKKDRREQPVKMQGYCPSSNNSNCIVDDIRKRAKSTIESQGRPEI